MPRYRHKPCSIANTSRHLKNFERAKLTRALGDSDRPTQLSRLCRLRGCQRAGKTYQLRAGENRPLEETRIRRHTFCNQRQVAGGSAWRISSRWPRFTRYRRYMPAVGPSGGLRGSSACIARPSPAMCRWPSAGRVPDRRRRGQQIKTGQTCPPDQPGRRVCVSRSGRPFSRRWSGGCPVNASGRI